MIAISLAAINQTFSLLDPFIFGKMINNFGLGFSKYEGGKSEYFYQLIKYILAAIGVAMVSRIAKNFQDYVTNVIIQKTGVDMYKDGLEHSLTLPFEEFEDQSSGETLNKLQKVRKDSEKFISSLISIIFQSCFGIFFVLIFTLKINYYLTIFLGISLPIIGFIVFFLSNKIKEVSKKILQQTTSLSGTTTESLRNIELIKSLGLTEQEISRLNMLTTKILLLELKKVKYIRSLSFVQGTVINMVRNALLLFLFYLIANGKIISGDLVTMVFYSFFIFGPLQELGNVIVSWRETEASLQNLKNLLNQKSELNPLNPIQINTIEKLNFVNVSFQHKTATTKSLQNISFEVNAGETVAFVGPSGSGKTTLVKLLVGLYKPIEGKILFNNISYEEIDMNEIRKQLGFVTQDNQLFSGTIKENLLFVKPLATEEECLTAMKRAACTTLLQRAQRGLMTIIGEGGIKLSGGEKQRLAIARALLREPKLLLFDEATSSLDSITEEEITSTVKEISNAKNVLTVMIAHRLSTIMHAEKIFVLEKGRIIESGNHDKLISENGLYYAMWRQQIGERKTEKILVNV